MRTSLPYFSDYHLHMMPGDLPYEKWATSGQGTGPFVLEAFERDRFSTTDIEELRERGALGHKT